MIARRCFQVMAKAPNKCPHSNKNHFSSLYIWGLNDNGQLGLGDDAVTSKPSAIPKKVEGLPPREVAHSVVFGVLHTALVTKTGRLFVAGSNIYGQLGLGDSSPEGSARFVELPGLPPLKQAACGDKHTLVLSRDGKAFSWGYGGSFFSVGALGRGQSAAPSSSPGEVEADSSFDQIAAGALHSVGLGTDGRVMSWGDSDFGVLGSLHSISFLRNGVEKPSFVDYFTNVRVKNIFACGNFCASLDIDGNLYMWGRNDKNQLGIENVNLDIQSCENVPVHIKNDFEKKRLFIEQIGLSSQRCVAISKDNKLYQWGQVFMWPTISDLGFESPLKKVGVGGNYQVALDAKGRLFMWGGNKHVLSFGRTMSPVLVTQFEGKVVKDFFAGENRIAVVTED